MEQKSRKRGLTNRSGASFVSDTIDALEAHICVVGMDGTILAVNEAWRRFGRDNPPFPNGCFVGESYLSVCDRAVGPGSVEAAPFAAGLRGVLRGKVAKYKLEYPCHAPAAERWFIARATRLPGAGPGRAVVAHEDITERKRAEDALRYAHQRLRRFVDANIVGLVIANEAGRILEANDYYLRLLGFSREEFNQGKLDWRALTPPEWIPADEAALRELRERGTCAPYEKEYVRRDGTRVAVLLADAMLPGPEEQIAAFVLDLSGRKRAEAELDRSREALRRLAARRERVREDERARIALQIHDELGHAMVDLRLDLAWLSRRLGEAGFNGRSVLRKRINSMSGRMEVAAATVRRIATELRPAVLDALGLLPAIEWQTQEFQQRTGIKCSVRTSGARPRLDALQSTGLFRMFQEILSNVALHSRASRVRVQLFEQGGLLVVRVHDNGRGITDEEKSSPTALGLLGMRERAAALGGEVEISRGREVRGTIVTVSIPIDPS